MSSRWDTTRQTSGTCMIQDAFGGHFQIRPLAWRENSIRERKKCKQIMKVVLFVKVA